MKTLIRSSIGAALLALCFTAAPSMAQASPRGKVQSIKQNIKTDFRSVKHNVKQDVRDLKSGSFRSAHQRHKRVIKSSHARHRAALRK